MKTIQSFVVLSIGAMSALQFAQAAPVISRLTPPSEPFQSNSTQPGVIISRFLPDQRFDIQTTVRPDAGQKITVVEFFINGIRMTSKKGNTSLVTTGLNKGLPENTAIASVRAFSLKKPGVYTLSVKARQSDGQIATATGNFEIVSLANTQGKVAKNIIFMLGDGMGATQRTAARIVKKGYAQGKATGLLAMDRFPYTGLVMTSSLNSIVTDSAPGMPNYVTGNKAANNQEGVWPDDTQSAFDNPRVEYLSEYLHRTRGTALGIVTTADVFDATPASVAAHTSNRGNGTGIVDQFFDDRNLTGLTVLMGGGRKWFLPNVSDSVKPQMVNGSQRRNATDYTLPSDMVKGWGVKLLGKK